MAEANEVKVVVLGGMTFNREDRTVRFEPGRYTLPQAVIFSFDSYELRAVNGSSGATMDFEPHTIAADSQEIEKQ